MTIPIAPSPMSWIYGPAGGVTTLPPGETIVTDTIYIDNQNGPTFRGDGQFRSVIRWRGPSDRPVIAIRNCKMADVGNFTIRFDTPAKDGIVIANLPSPLAPGTVTTTKCFLHDLWIEAGTSGGHYVNDGIKIDSGYYGGTDNNNELHRIERCTINGFAHAGVGIYSSQSHQNLIQDCQFGNSNAVPTGMALYALFGSQQFIRNNGGNLNLMVYASDQFCGSCKIIDNDFESMSRFVDCRLPQGQWVIENNRCGVIPLKGTYGDYPNAVVFCHGNGYTSFKNNIIDSQNPNGPPIRLQFGGNKGLSVVGNRFQTNPVIYVQTLDPVSPAHMWYGNTWQDAAGANIVIPPSVNYNLSSAPP